MPYPITHFEIHVSDVDRAKKFYGELFGWTFQDWDMGETKYTGIMTKDGERGANGGFVMRHGAAPVEGAAVNAYVCTMEITEPVDGLLEKIVAAGGTIALPKMPIPGMGWLGYGKDLDGNIFGILQADKEAK
jgi:predicted enzyme related to lactoylglutathione lyase